MCCHVRTCAKQVSEHSAAAAPQVELGSVLTGTRCPEQSPASANNKLKRGRGAASDGGEGKETHENGGEEGKATGENMGMRSED